MKTAIGYADITPADSVPLMGYGDRTHSSEGVHDPLLACAWWLETPKGRPLVWAVLDLCLMSVISTRELVGELASTAGLAAEQIFVSANHTHSGPDASFVTRSEEPWAQRYRRKLLEGCSQAIRRAREAAVEGRIEVRLAQSDLGVNRRDAAAPIDPRVVLFSLLDAAGKLRGLLFHYSCHLTALGVDNYLISADWLAPVRAALREELGVPVMFLQGAEGNVDPVCRGALDMADPDQAVGCSFQVVEQTSLRMSEALSAGLRTSPVATLTQATACGVTLSLPLRFGALSPAQVQDRLEEWKSRFADFLGIEPQEVPEDSIINAMIKEHCRRQNLDPEQTRRWVAEQFTYVSFLNIYKTGGELIDPGKGEVSCPIQVLDLGKVVLLGIPMEVLLDVAFDWQRRLPGRIALIAGLFNGWIGYLPHRDNYSEPRAAQLYETVCTMFAPEASIRLLDSARELLAASG